MTYLSASSGTTTLAGDTTYTGADFHGTALLAMGAFSASFTDEDEGVYFYDDWDISYDDGAKFKFINDTMVEFEGDATGPNGTFGPTFPPVEVTGAGGVSILTVRCVSWTQSNGVLQSDSSQVLDVLGNFLMTGGSLNGAVVHVAGTAEAYGITITNCDFSGGTALSAIGCTDGGGNTNVTFFPVTNWTDGDGDHDWGNAANWDNGVPSSTKAAVIAGAGTVVIGGSTRDAKTLNLSGFTGTWDDSSFRGVNVYGSVSIGDFTTADGTFYLVSKASGTVTMHANPTFWYGEIDLDSGAGITLTLASDVRLAYIYMSASDNVVALGGHRLVLTGTENGLGMTLTAANNFTWATGGGIDVAPLVGSGGQVTISGSATAVMPPMTFTGIDPTDNLSFGSGVASIASYSQTIGVCGGSSPSDTLDVLGDLTLDCDGFNFAGVDVGGGMLVNGGTLAPASGTTAYTVAGSAVAHDATITNCDFSGGTELDASDNCVDGGGNTNVDFGAVAPTADAGPDQSITLPDGVLLAGSATGDEPITYAWTKVSGPGTVTFVDNTDPATTATFSASGTYVLRLTATNAGGSDSDDMTALVHPTTVEEPESGRSGTVEKVALTSLDRAIVLPADTNAVFCVKSPTAWTYHSPEGVDWPISAGRVIRLSVGAGTPLTFYARTATTATLFIYQER